MTNLAYEITEMARNAQKAARSVAALTTEAKNNVLLHMAKALDAKREYIQAENNKDLVAGQKKGLSPAMLDRLELSDNVIESMMNGLREVASLPDPVGRWKRWPNVPTGLWSDACVSPLA